MSRPDPRIRPGVMLRVIDADGLSKDHAKILFVGARVLCDRVNESGSVVIHGHGGLFRARRFTVD